MFLALKLEFIQSVRVSILCMLCRATEGFFYLDRHHGKAPLANNICSIMPRVLRILLTHICSIGTINEPAS